MQIGNIPLTHTNMWVQINNLPMGLMKETVGVKLANYIGSFVEYDKNNGSSFWRQYMRIRVQIDVRKPLKKDTKEMNREGQWCTVNFKYEKLGIFSSFVVSWVTPRISVKYALQWSKMMVGGIGRQIFELIRGGREVEWLRGG
jgi:hypothetical protein